MQQRRLAVIMFTDIVGYTSLMGKDEKKALNILQKNRRVHWRLIRKYKGKLLKEMGDGILACFPSSTEAVVCALAIQKVVGELDIPVRIGIHLGDVIFEDKDVLGDGVNIASRIQGVAETNGIVISEKVYSDVRNKSGLETEFIGEKDLKGVASSQRVYRIWCPDYTMLDISVDTGELIRPLRLSKPGILVGLLLIVALAGIYLMTEGINKSDRQGKSLLVLPFDDFTGSDTLEYFVAGMHSSLIAELGRISGLRVISPHTSMTYKNTEMSLSEIAEELNVDHIIDAAVICLGDSIWFQPKLFEVEKKERQIWSGNYTNDVSDVLNLYHEVTKGVSREINVMLTPEEAQKLEERKTVNPEAYRLYLQGRHLWILDGKENLAKSIEYYEQALQIDPDFAQAYVGIAITYTSFGWYLFEPNRMALPKAAAAASKALEMDNTLGGAHAELAFTKLILDHDWRGSEQSFKRAIELNPNDARAHNMYAWLLAMEGRHKEAIAESKTAYQLDPLSVGYWTEYGRHYYYARDYDRAIEEFKKIIETYPDSRYSTVSWMPRAYLGLTLLQKGKYSEAIDEFNKADYESSWYAYLGHAYAVAGETTKANEILDHYLELYKSNPIWGGTIAFLYLGLGDKDRAFEWLEKAFEQREGWIPFMNMAPIFDPLKDDRRYKDLLRRMNFPE